MSGLQNQGHIQNCLVAQETAYERMSTGSGAAWLARLPWEQEVVGSNPISPIFSSVGRAKSGEKEQNQTDEMTRRRS